jgi:hypothetical protein
VGGVRATAGLAVEEYSRAVGHRTEGQHLAGDAVGAELYKVVPGDGHGGRVVPGDLLGVGRTGRGEDQQGEKKPCPAAWHGASFGAGLKRTLGSGGILNVPVSMVNPTLPGLPWDSVEIAQLASTLRFAHRLVTDGPVRQKTIACCHATQPHP